LKVKEKALELFEIPVPIAEQSRIVNKVNELMSLCDNWNSNL
jgi:restriction endonuclease S subunit